MAFENKVVRLLLQADEILLRADKFNRNNTSGFKCVYWSKQRSKWYSVIHSNGKIDWLGFYSTPEEASAVYEQEAALRFGDLHHKLTKDV